MKKMSRQKKHKNGKIEKENSHDSESYIIKKEKVTLSISNKSNLT